MNIRRKLFAVPVALLIAVSAAAQSAPPARPVSIVLVHGALIDGSSWRGVYDILVRHGFRVRVVQQPLTGLSEDVAATARVIDQQEGPVVLVGHSYGGAATKARLAPAASTHACRRVRIIEARPTHRGSCRNLLEERSE